MSATTTSPESNQVPAPSPAELNADDIRRSLLGSTLQSVLAVLSALILGGLLIAATDERSVQKFYLHVCQRMCISFDPQ